MKMKKTIAWSLTVLLGALAQQVQLPDPSGPVVEARSPSVEATLRLQGCTRDQGGQVVCSLQVQSTARTNQQVTVLHQSVRAISARGFSYPGYLVAEGGKVESNRSTFALPAGARVAARLVFPKVPQEETTFAAVFIGGVEFRGIPIGSPGNQAVQGRQGTSQGQAQAQGTPLEVVIRSFEEPVNIQVGEAVVKLDRCYRGYGYVQCEFTLTSTVEGSKVLFELPNSAIFRLTDGSAYEQNLKNQSFVERQDGGKNPIQIPVANTPFRVRMQIGTIGTPSYDEIIRLDMQLTYFGPDDKKGETLRILIRNAKLKLKD